MPTKGIHLQFKVVENRSKPHMGGGDGPFLKAKVVRADDRAKLVRTYRDAAGEIGGENVVVQELVSGGGGKPVLLRSPLV